MDIADGMLSFILPSHALASDARVRVYTNEVHPEWGGFSFGFGRAVWNNSVPDLAALFDASGTGVQLRTTILLT